MSGESDRLLDLEKKFAATEVLVTRFDSALDKISEVSLNVSKLLAVHEQRLEAQEAFAMESKEIHSSLHSRMSSTEQRLRQEMADGQKEILVEIKSLRLDVEELGDELSSKTDALKTDLKSQIDLVSTRVTKLERLSYYIIGGALVIGFILSQATSWLGIFH